MFSPGTKYRRCFSKYGNKGKSGCKCARKTVEILRKILDESDSITFTSICRLGPIVFSNFSRKLGLVVYLTSSSVSVDTILINICYLINKLQTKLINI